MRFFFFNSDIKNGCALENEVDYPNVFFYHEESEEMYVGGKDYVSKLNVNDFNTIEVCAEVNSMLLTVRGCVCVCLCECVSVPSWRLSLTTAALVGYNHMLGLTNRLLPQTQ